jgi:hypothetical protein
LQIADCDGSATLVSPNGLGLQSKHLHAPSGETGIAQAARAEL